MQIKYPAIVRKAADSDYGVDFPDFPGCVTAGLTPEEAADFAAEALALHIDDMREGDPALPTPTPGADVVVDLEEGETAYLIFVPAPAIKSRAVRVNVTLPEELLRQIDNHAPNRSAFLASAARAALARRKDI